ncbi:hypothetical protein [uncultured Desulfovibrio sp.]|uniref:hypothetical protein n=1 Tax=uncultured Desulfovibrio sp. TaxID=167968 RepID=UPI002711D237|nr:hypothetical protein [uncultured Desulfovibrio sp.]
MKPQLYIHIGFPKTGTTALQDFFYTHKAELEKSGIFYPAPLLGPMLAGHQGHLSLSATDSLLRHDAIPWTAYQKAYLDQLLAAKCKINILSAESLPYDPPANLSIFRNHFQIKIICFFRNIFDFFVSLKKQVIKEGLRQGIFILHLHRNFQILARVEEYINFFGQENCIFVNYDKIKKDGNIIDVFLKTIHADFDYSRASVKNSNVTPPDAASMFLYQLSFLPFSFAEWAVVRNEILAMDLSAWRDFRCTLLPPCFFNLDDEARQAIGRQGQLLQDPHWYDASLARGKELAAIPNHDLPPRIQHDIFNRLSEKARAILARHWPGAAQASPAKPLLPSMEHMEQESFELLKQLHQGYTISIATTVRLQNKLNKEAEREREREREREPAWPQRLRALASYFPNCGPAAPRSFRRTRDRHTPYDSPACSIFPGILSAMPTWRGRPLTRYGTMCATARAKAATRPRGFPLAPMGAPIPMCSRTA